MFFTRIDAEQEGDFFCVDKIVQTILTTIPIHYISSWSPSYEASQKLGLQLYENIDQNSIFLSLSWLTKLQVCQKIQRMPTNREALLFSALDIDILVRLNSISLSLSWLNKPQTEGIYRPLQFASIIAYHKEDQHVLWSTSNKHPVDLCIIIMLFLICPYSSSTDPGVRQLQELHAGGEVGGEEGGHL